jgi:hypothetical protein
MASANKADTIPVKNKMHPIAAKLVMAPTRPANAIDRQSRCVAKILDPRNMTCADWWTQWLKVVAIFSIVDDQFWCPVKFRDK